MLRRDVSTGFRVVPLVALLCGLLALPGCVGDVGGEGEVADGSLVDDVLIAPHDDTLHSALLSGQTQVIYLNFDGVRVDDCDGYCSDAPSNRSWAIGEWYGRSTVTWAPYTGDRQIIVDFVRQTFEPYNVSVVTRRPASGHYTMAVISPTWAPNHGVSPLNCDNTNPNDIVFIAKTDSWSAQRNAQAVAHELGHSFGLAHVRSTAAIMDWAAHGSRYGVADYDADHPSGKCMSGNRQDAPLMLRSALGARPAGERPLAEGTQLFFRNAHAGGDADFTSFVPDAAEDIFVGDWDGDGIDTPGFRVGNRFHLDNGFDGHADIAFGFGRPSDTPLVGDWDGDGVDTVGVWREGIFYLANEHAPVAAHQFRFGSATDVPLSGDWDGDGVDTVGIRRAATFHLRNVHFGGAAEISYSYGRAGDSPLVGDWDGDGVDTIGIRRDRSYYLRNVHFGGAADITYAYGTSRDAPMSGDWDGDGVDNPGLVRW